MRNSMRPAKTDVQIARLERKHATLKQQLAEFEGRSFLTVNEEVQMHTLKKIKLATKDALLTAKREFR